MEYSEYYDGLNWRGIVYNHYWLIVIIEAAWYCDSRNKECIRYSHLRKVSNEVLRRETKNEQSVLSGGTFKSVIYNDKIKEFFPRVEKIKNKNKIETWIYPNISRIQEEIRYRKIENLKDGHERLARMVNKYNAYDRKNGHRIIDEPSIRVSDSVTRQTSKARALPIESVSVSDGVSISVTRHMRRISKEQFDQILSLIGITEKDLSIENHVHSVGTNYTETLYKPVKHIQFQKIELSDAGIRGETVILYSYRSLSFSEVCPERIFPSSS